MSYLLHHLLIKSANTYPDKEAICCDQGLMTYGELEMRSNQMANMLLKLGVVRGDRVGIYLDKSIEAVITIFAILKAGGVYVPLDPYAPITRIAFIVQNCQIKTLVSTKQKIGALRSKTNLPSLQRVILVDENRQDQDQNQAKATLPRREQVPKVVTWSEVLQCSKSQPPNPALIEQDLAYILYTSGSTGTPKGVMISHRASLTFVNWAYNTFQVRPEDRVSSHAPFHFDLSIFDLFTTIKAGGTVILLPAVLSVFPINLANFIAKQKISIWYSVPSALTRLVLYGKIERYKLPHLRTVLFAGEVFPIKHLRQLMEKIPHARYYNLYGPTETNVCTYYEVPPLEPERVEPLPIGKACANSDVFVLNEQNEPLAPGEVGELCVRGPSLMTGYWGLPEKSAQVRHPYVRYPALGAEMIYHTGDLVKQAPDGNYLYLGRRDNMIKSRGYRIELGEIESVLYSHPAVEEAAVIAIPDDEIGNRIKAVIVTHDKEKTGTDTGTLRNLQSFCAQQLPKYMIPHSFEFRPTLPKTSTGKVDKTQLRENGAITLPPPPDAEKPC